MEPTIYKPSIYKGAGIYKTGAGGGIYKGRGVYNDGAGGGDFLDFGGKKYPIVKIGSLFWTANNLDYIFNGLNIGGSPSTSIVTPHAYYYFNDENTYGWQGRKYGLYYNRYAIDEIKNLIPQDWRLPTGNDFNDFISSVGVNNANKLKTTDFWQTPGDNELNFNAVPSTATNPGAGTFYTDEEFIIMADDNNGQKSGLLQITNTIVYYPEGTSFIVGMPIRLCKDA